MTHFLNLKIKLLNMFNKCQFKNNDKTKVKTTKYVEYVLI